jgi:pimeloyl-ACP methyl ester carboxylesterase
MAEGAEVLMRRAAALWLFIALAMPPLLAVPAVIEEVGISFSVVNENTSRTSAACKADGKGYTVRGAIAAPRSALVDTADNAVTLYLHGSGDGSEWNFTGFPDVDYLAGMAGKGHVSVFIHLLGYGTSDPVDGNALCVGSWASMAHQVVQHLRAGTYDAGGLPTPTFERVALAGHSGGVIAAELYSVSFDDIDALIGAGWADTAPTFVPLFTGAGKLVTECIDGGSSKEPGGPPGWARLFGADDLRRLLYNTDPDVLEAFIDRYEMDFCGLRRDIGPALAVNMALSPLLVRVPVLLIFGDHDPFSPGAYEIKRTRYVSSHDVTLKVLPNAGHNAMMGRTAVEYREVMSAWLKARRF